MPGKRKFTDQLEPAEMFDSRTRARLAALPPAALEILGAAIDGLSQDITEAIHLAENRQAEAKTLTARKAEILAAVPMLATYLHAGMGIDAALRSCAQQTGIEVADLQIVCLSDAKRRANGMADRRVRRRIMRMVALGYTDAAIAGKLVNPKTGKPYHPKSINRMQRQERLKAKRLAVDAA